MTRDQEALLLTVARVLRAKVTGEIYAEQADDLAALNEVLEPFGSSSSKSVNECNDRRAEFAEHSRTQFPLLVDTGKVNTGKPNLCCV
jgi:hypothetical protein